MGNIIVNIEDAIGELATILQQLPAGAQSRIARVGIEVQNITRTQFDNNIAPLLRNLKTTYPNAQISFSYVETE